MFKDNGRLTPATKEEVASVTGGKLMVCPSCNSEFHVSNVQFASAICETCGEKLTDINMAKANKATGS